MVKMEKQYFPWHTLRNVLVGWAGKRSTFVCVPTYWLSLLMLFTILLLFMFFSPIVAAAAAAVYFFCVQRLVKLLCEQASYLWLEWIWNCAWKAAITYAQFPHIYEKRKWREKKRCTVDVFAWIFHFRHWSRTNKMGRKTTTSSSSSSFYRTI